MDVQSSLIIWLLPISFVKSGAYFLIFFFLSGKFMHTICTWMEGEYDHVPARFQLTWCLAYRFLTFHSNCSWLNLFLTFHFDFSTGMVIRSDGFRWQSPSSLYPFIQMAEWTRLLGEQWRKGSSTPDDIGNELHLHLQDVFCFLGQAEEDWNNEVSSIIIINLSCSLQSLLFLSRPSL